MRKKLLCFIIISAIVGECLAVCLCVSITPVYALSAGGLQTTIASVIMSLFLQSGAAPVNQTYIDMINTSYGVESSIGTIEDMITNGLLTESGGTLVDTGLSTAIENAPAYNTLNLGDVFSTYADDVAEGVIAGSGGVNLANTAINCGTVGTVGAFAGAATVGVGLGVLINKVGGYIRDFAKYGLPMSAETRQQIGNNIPSGFDSCYYGARKNGGRTYATYVFTQGDTAGAAYLQPEGNARNAYDSLIYAMDSEEYNYQYLGYTNESLTNQQTGTYRNSPPVHPSMGNSSANTFIDINMPMFNNFTEADTYLKNIKNGIVEKPEVNAPDVIGKNGNIKGNEQLSPMVPSGKDMYPVEMDDYQDYADIANENTDNDVVGVPQGEEFINLVDPLIMTPSLVPDQGITPPDVENRPAIPEQPIMPPKDPAETEDIETTLAGVTTPELTKVFPFCIPFDVYAMFSNLKYEVREAPVIEFEFPMDQYTGAQQGYWRLEIDFSRYEQAAEVLRHCELLLFIVGLAIATKNFLYGIG